MNITDDYKINI